MVKALNGALDYVINDIQPEGQKEIFFMDMLPQFNESVKGVLIDGMKKITYATKPMIEEVGNEVRS
jgi:hypothetical protein